MGPLILCVGLLGLVAFISLYWTLLMSMYPERVRKSETYRVTTSDLWQLRLLRYRKGRTEGEPVLLLHGLGSNQHSFTSPEKHCLVDHLVERGYDCWAVDLRGCRSSRPPFGRYRAEITVDDFLLQDLPTVVGHIQKTTGYAGLHWVGHSLGGVLIYAYAQEFGEDHIASGTTLGAPIGYEGANFKIPKWHLFLIQHVPRLCGNVIRGIIPLCFWLRGGATVYPTNLNNLASDMGPGELINAIEDPLPGVFHEIAFWAKNQVIRMKEGQMDVAAGLKQMRFPLLTIYGALDRLTPREYANRFVNSLKHNKKVMLVLSKENGCAEDYNHCDLLFGKNGTKEVYEPIAQWLASHPSKEHLQFSEEETDPYSGPLDVEQRSDILSGESFAHLTSLVEAPFPAPTTRSRRATTVKVNPKIEQVPAATKKRAEKKIAAKKTPTKKKRARRGK